MTSAVPELPHLVERKKTVKGGRYGHIPEFPVGTRFPNREAMYNCGFHVTLQAGIQGREAAGACSVVLSGGYEDDVDLGYEFTYTGHGGQLPMQNKDRSQKKDQEWKHGNLALKTSCKLRKPIRVIRGSRLLSRWAPAEGYRYDGLYNVTEYGRKPGRSGHLVCLFRFERCPNQPPLPEPTGPRQEPRTLRHISPSTASRPSTPSLPAKKRRRSSEEADANRTSKKLKSSTKYEPLFIEGSSKKVLGASPGVYARQDYQESPGSGRGSLQMSPEFRKDFSEGPASSYEGKGKSADLFSLGAGTDNDEIDDEDMYMSDERDAGINHVVSEPETRVKVEDVYTNYLVSKELEGNLEDDDDIDLLEVDLAYPDENELLSQGLFPISSSSVQISSGDCPSEYEESEVKQKDDENNVEFTYESQEATFETEDETTMIDKEGRFYGSEREEEEEKDDEAARYADVKYHSGSEDEGSARREKEADGAIIKVKKEEEAEKGVEEDDGDDEEEDSDDDDDDDFYRKIPLFQYAVRSAGPLSRRKRIVKEDEDEDSSDSSDEGESDPGPAPPISINHKPSSAVESSKYEADNSSSNMDGGDLVDELAADLASPVAYTASDFGNTLYSADSPPYAADDAAQSLVGSTASFKTPPYVVDDEAEVLVDPKSNDQANNAT